MPDKKKWEDQQINRNLILFMFGLIMNVWKYLINFVNRKMLKEQKGLEKEYNCWKARSKNNIAVVTDQSLQPP